MTTEWECIIKDKNIEKVPAISCPVTEHPLKQMTITLLDSRGTRKFGPSGGTINMNSSTLSLDPLSLALDGTDPLSQFAKQESLDPLSQMAAEYEQTHSTKLKYKNNKPLKDSAESWNLKRAAVLNKFTTAEKLSIVTSFLTGGEMIKTQTTMSDKVKYRLEQLDDFEDGSIRHMMDLTQQEYVIKIEQLNQELVNAWHNDQRVKALKIAIQCSKMLADTNVIQFYPSKFVLITDILDIFGKLVYERLRTKAEYYEPGSNISKSLPENFTADMVPEQAKETCQNWFYKIASIRELLPRLYVETAILKSYSFLTTSEFNQALMRLTKMIRGVGDPLISLYSRCYLCRVGMTLTSDREYIKENLYDFLFIYNTIYNNYIQNFIKKNKISLNMYLSLYAPALDWILQGVSANCSDSILNEVLEKCQEKENNGLLINSIMSSFPLEFISVYALLFINIIVKNTNQLTEGITKSELLKTLGYCLSKKPPVADQRLTVLNNAWIIITNISNIHEYISTVDMWTQYISENFGLKEVNKFLGDLYKHILKDRYYEIINYEIKQIIEKIIIHVNDTDNLIILDNFLPIIDLLNKETIKSDLCKNIMLKYNQNTNNIINDPVIVNSFMYICRILNDSVNALTVDDEKKQLSNVISNFIMNVNYHNDYEKQLQFYVDARSVFTNLDYIYQTLIHCVNKLTINYKNNTININNGKMINKYFFKVCSAYCFITIPSIISIITRLELYLLTGQVALSNLCLGQADACFETALNLLMELPKFIEYEGKQKNTEIFFNSYICNFLSTLIIVPDSPDRDVLYLLRLLINVIKNNPYDDNNTNITILYLNLLDMLTIISQNEYPIKIPFLITNDQLYYSDKKFLNEINIISTDILDNLLNIIKNYGKLKLYNIQINITTDLLIKLILNTNINNNNIYMLINNLIIFLKKNINKIDNQNSSNNSNSNTIIIQNIYNYLTNYNKYINKTYKKRYNEILMKLNEILI